MEIQNRYAFRFDDKKCNKLLKDYILPYKDKDIIRVALINEKAKDFISINKKIPKSIIPQIITKFTKEEIGNCHYLRIQPSWHNQYPQPEESFEYLNNVYEKVCSRCGYVENQINSFQLRSEPNWGGNDILQINWVFDEFFVSPQIYDIFFKPLNIKKLPVLKYSNKSELETIVQLVTNEVYDEEFEIENQEYYTCEECNKKRYIPFTKGFFPINCSEADFPIIKTKNRFGGGGILNHSEILFRNDLYKTLHKGKIKGIDFYATKEL